MATVLVIRIINIKMKTDCHFINSWFSDNNNRNSFTTKNTPQYDLTVLYSFACVTFKSWCILQFLYEWLSSVVCGFTLHLLSPMPTSKSICIIDIWKRVVRTYSAYLRGFPHITSNGAWNILRQYDPIFSL